MSRFTNTKGRVELDTWKTALKTFGVIIVSFLVVPLVVAFLMWLASGQHRSGFSQAHIFSVRYLASVVVLMLLLVPFFWYAAKREPGAPLTWGEAMVAATYTFFVFFWLFGVVPHEFLNWADSELAWRPDKKIIGPEGTWASWWSFWKDIPLTIHLQIIRDVLVTTLYGVGLGGLIWAFAFWNDRAKKAAAAGEVEPVSAYGGPLVTKAKS